MKVPFLDLAALHAPIRPELDAAVARVLDSGRFVLGPEVDAFESEFASYVGARHCVAMGNGLDAIHLALRALGVGPGDEVLVPSHTFVATWLAVDLCGATPIPVEPEAGSFLMDPAQARLRVTNRTRAVLPVHLYGEPLDLAPFRELCVEHDLALLQDAAQAHGAVRAGIRVGSVGTAAWSFYPGKNLGALGDGGGVTTDDDGLAQRLRLWRNYGSEHKYVHEVRGFNSRLDEVQAAVLRTKLPRLDDDVIRRRAIAARYLTEMANLPITLPSPVPGSEPAWHLFVIQCADRDRVMAALSDSGVAAQIHYPSAVHQQEAYRALDHQDADLPLAARYAGQVLSLPMDPTMTDDAVAHVVDSLRGAVT